MESIVRLTHIELSNFKNVRSGRIKLNSSFEKMDSADVLGIYGQNGSGKTAVVEALDLLKTLLQGSSREQSLPALSEHFHYYNEKEMALKFQFVILNGMDEFTARYTVLFDKGEKNIMLSFEKLEYRENLRGHRFKELVLKDKEKLKIRNKELGDMNENDRVSLLLSNKLAKSESTSFIFRRELADTYETNLKKIELDIIKCLSEDFLKDFHVIKATNYGYLVANIVLPFSIHYENMRGEIPYTLDETALVPLELFEVIEKTIAQINVVLHKVIPDLYIITHKINEQKLADGNDGVRFEFLSRKGETVLPLKSESSGTLKIISILSTLIAVYNNPNACVVIDELDAGIFEFLLGEMLELISENGQGQLIFTSHNLRVLEVLPAERLLFSTINEENRYIQLKGVRGSNNIRDLYIRAVQLGGQGEKLYAETNSFSIKKAFRKAGKNDG